MKHGRADAASGLRLKSGELPVSRGGARRLNLERRRAAGVAGVLADGQTVAADVLGQPARQAAVELLGAIPHTALKTAAVQIAAHP